MLLLWGKNALKQDSRPTKSTNGSLWGLTTVTHELLAFAATVVRDHQPIDILITDLELGLVCFIG